MNIFVEDGHVEHTSCVSVTFNNNHIFESGKCHISRAINKEISILLAKEKRFGVVLSISKCKWKTVYISCRSDCVDEIISKISSKLEKYENTELINKDEHPILYQLITERKN